MFRRKTGRAAGKAGFSRKAALRGRPVKLPALEKELKEEKLYITVQYERPGWQRVLGAERTCRRTFALDAYGQSVYDRCDGRTSVRKIIEDFAAKHHVSVAEAELSVTTFMKTLVGKGLVGIQMR